jgi:hypothetical protein
MRPNLGETTEITESLPDPDPVAVDRSADERVDILLKIRTAAAGIDNARPGEGTVRNFCGARRDLHGFGSWAGEDHA